jgi:hypothetical protein
VTDKVDRPPACLDCHNLLQKQLTHFYFLIAIVSSPSACFRENPIVSSLLQSPTIMALAGGKRPVDLQNCNNLEIDELAKFAVSEHNNQETNAPKKSFSKVVSAHTQVVQGTMYHLLIEVEEENKPKHYEAKVWVKTWEHFKKLESFTPKDAST